MTQQTPHYSVSRSEAAKALNISPITLDRMMAAGQLRAIKVVRPGCSRGRVRIDATSLDAMLRGDLAAAAAKKATP